MLFIGFGGLDGDGEGFEGGDVGGLVVGGGGEGGGLRGNEGFALGELAPDS